MMWMTMFQCEKLTFTFRMLVYQIGSLTEHSHLISTTSFNLQFTDYSLTPHTLLPHVSTSFNWQMTTPFNLLGSRWWEKSNSLPYVRLPPDSGNLSETMFSCRALAVTKEKRVVFNHTCSECQVRSFFFFPLQSEYWIKWSESDHFQFPLNLAASPKVE